MIAGFYKNRVRLKVRDHTEFRVAVVDYQKVAGIAALFVFRRRTKRLLRQPLAGPVRSSCT